MTPDSSGEWFNLHGMAFHALMIIGGPETAKNESEFYATMLYQIQ